MKKTEIAEVEVEATVEVIPPDPKVELLEKELMKEADEEAKGKGRLRLRGGVNIHGLNEMEEAFCMSYAKHRSGKKALSDAGYAMPAGNFYSQKVKSILDRPRIQKRIKEIQELAAIDVPMSRNIFHHKIMTIYEQALASQEFQAANRAMELLGKSLNYFEEPIKKNLNISANMSSLPPEQRLENLRRLASALGMKSPE